VTPADRPPTGSETGDSPGDRRGRDQPPAAGKGLYLNAYASRTARFYERVESGKFGGMLAAGDALARLTKPQAVLLTDDQALGTLHLRSRG